MRPAEAFILLPTLPRCWELQASDHQDGRVIFAEGKEIKAAEIADGIAALFEIYHVGLSAVCEADIRVDQGVVRVILERWDERLRKMKRRALSHAQSLWTKEVWIELGGYAEVRVAGDTELLLRAKYASLAVNVFKGIKPAQKCRIHSGNASQTSLIERKRWLLQREQKLRAN